MPACTPQLFWTTSGHVVDGGGVAVGIGEPLEAGDDVVVEFAMLLATTALVAIHWAPGATPTVSKAVTPVMVPIAWVP